MPVKETRRRSLTALVASLSAVTLALSASYAAVLVVLLPNQVAALDPSDKVSNLAVVTTVSFAATIVAQPLVGALSDVTRSRLGRRVPWAASGAVVAAVALVCLGHASSLLLVGALWVVAQVALNTLDIATSAVVPDEVPSARRGRGLALIGSAGVLGGAVAVAVAGPRADSPEAVYVGLGAGLLVACTVFVVASVRHGAGVAHDAVGPSPAALDPARGRGPSVPARPGIVRRCVDACRREPRYVRVFTSRLLFVLAYHLVYAYQLFILTDHLRLSTPRANEVLVVLTVLSLASVLVGVGVTGWWSDRVGDRTRFMVGACGLLAVALLVPLAVPSVTGMIVFAVLKGLAFGVHLASSSALVTEVLPGGGATPGRDLGIYNVATNVPQTVAPAVAGLVIGHLGGYPSLFVVACGVALLALVTGRQVEPDRS